MLPNISWSDLRKEKRGKGFFRSLGISKPFWSRVCNWNARIPKWESRNLFLFPTYLSSSFYRFRLWVFPRRQSLRKWPQYPCPPTRQCSAAAGWDGPETAGGIADPDHNYTHHNWLEMDSFVMFLVGWSVIISNLKEIKHWQSKQN